MSPTLVQAGRSTQPSCTDDSSPKCHFLALVSFSSPAAPPINTSSFVRWWWLLLIFSVPLSASLSSFLPPFSFLTLFFAVSIGVLYENKSLHHTDFDNQFLARLW